MSRHTTPTVRPPGIMETGKPRPKRPRRYRERIARSLSPAGIVHRPNICQASSQRRIDQSRPGNSQGGSSGVSARSGFVINELELKGFMRYRDPAKIPLVDKFTVITGPTGSGKTSLLDAVT